MLEACGANPTEPINQIFTYVWWGKLGPESVKACSLVSKDFLSIARPLIFSRIEFNEAATSLCPAIRKRLCSCVETSPKRCVTHHI